MQNAHRKYTQKQQYKHALYSTTKQHHIIEKRSGKNWLVDKMCFACAEKSSFQDTTYTEHAVGGRYIVQCAS